MMNFIWLGLLVVAFVVAAIKGTGDAVTKAAVESAKTAVEISIGLVGVMSLWLGIMKIAEEAGLVRLLGRLIAPIARFVFPEIPKDHPAMGSIILTFAATALGLNNAATPLGIKAMEELQELNGGRATASNAMVMFAALNTAGIQFIPATMIAVLAAAGSKQPTAIIGSSLAATTIGSIAAVIATRALQPFFPYKDEPQIEAEAEIEAEGSPL
jgi:spore maturation protein A